MGEDIFWVDEWTKKFCSISFSVEPDYIFASLSKQSFKCIFAFWLLFCCMKSSNNRSLGLKLNSIQHGKLRGCSVCGRDAHCLTDPTKHGNVTYSVLRNIRVGWRFFLFFGASRRVWTSWRHNYGHIGSIGYGNVFGSLYPFRVPRVSMTWPSLPTLESDW